eukprot:TRINITY_DN36663_c0_g1_i3.p3 TRINITY_DN36663_c0_g1~~TRINITY_DN36663_c0_g1_i3.p3  ORF type:complete len:129 (-),score=23.92 TRINITY_DN36663_c0_g1_i3:426-812(-)
MKNFENWTGSRQLKQFDFQEFISNIGIFGGSDDDDDTGFPFDFSAFQGGDDDDDTGFPFDFSAFQGGDDDDDTGFPFDLSAIQGGGIDLGQLIQSFQSVLGENDAFSGLLGQIQGGEDEEEQAAAGGY